MGRAPCCSKVGLRRGPWTANEDALLSKYIEEHGEGHWRTLPKKAGLLRCGKSCRLRWMNYLRPDIKRGNIEPDEVDLIIRLHALLGNRWSLIAGRLPGRTDNEIKNYWNTHLSKRLGTSNGAAHPIAEGLKKRKSNNKTNPKKKTKSEEIEERKLTKIHLPKPTRLTSLQNARKVNENGVGKASNSELGSGSYTFEKELKKDLDIPWVYLKDCELLEDEVGNEIDFTGNPRTPTEDGTLEKLYEEYLDLLKVGEEQVQLDNSGESFW